MEGNNTIKYKTLLNATTKTIRTRVGFNAEIDYAHKTYLEIRQKCSDGITNGNPTVYRRTFLSLHATASPGTRRFGPNAYTRGSVGAKVPYENRLNI